MDNAMFCNEGSKLYSQRWELLQKLLFMLEEL